MTYAEANSAIFKLFYDAFRPGAEALLGYLPTVYWPDKKEPESAPVNKAWVRITRKTLDERLAGFGEGDAQSIRRYDVAAVMFVQLFYPQGDGNASEKFPALCQLIKESLQGVNDPTNRLWTRSSSIKELDSEKAWFKKNVVVEFTYQEIRGN